MEEEAVLGEMLAIAQATRRNGGIVIVQVKRMAQRGTLHPKNVRIPGILVDFVVVDRDQRQTYQTYYDPSYSGELRIPDGHIKSLPFGPRKVIVRRAAMELFPGAVCNLGAGVSTGLSTIVAEEGLLDAAILTNEQGLIGGAPIMGRDSGGGQNFAAMIEQPAQFDFYDGGGLDLAFLSFAEVDNEGNVNVSRFGDKIIGVGGFINISQNARCVIFSGTLTAGGLDIVWDNGRTVIRSEGRHRKFVPRIAQVKSPEGFSERFATAGMNAVMIPLQVLPGHFDQTIIALKAIGNLDGLIMTVPYKAEAARFADRLGPTASKIRALNAMRREPDGTWTGEMFDGKGFVRGARA